jgi:aminoglycoside phosphotransferase (APT) family kinase protein
MGAGMDNRQRGDRELAAAELPEKDRPNLEVLLSGIFPGKTVRGYQLLVERGISNIKFRCSLDDGNEFLVRINERHRPEVARSRFEKASFCADLLRSEDIPIPRVVEVGLLPNGRPYSIEEWLQSGVVADTVREETGRCAIWHDLGQMTCRWSCADLHGAEKELQLGFDGDSPTQSWTDHVADLAEAIEREMLLGLTEWQKSALLSRLHDFDLMQYPHGLCHGDLKLDNVLVDPANGKIAAVLDWEFARFVPRFVGEFSTSFEPAVSENKRFAVARTAAERDAFARGCGLCLHDIEEAFLIFYAGDIFMNLEFYARAVSSPRPDRDQLVLRRDNYLNGIRDDVSAITSLLL